MLKIDFTTQEVEALHYYRFHHPHPRVQLRMEVLYLKNLNLPHHHICRIAGISPNTLRSYLRIYQQGGIEQLQILNFHKPQSLLLDHKETIEQHLNDNPPATIKQAQAKIAQLTGIERSPTQIREFLLKVGFKCRKVGQIPAKASVEKQQEFLDQQLEPRLQEAGQGKRAVFFIDAAHFVFAPLLGFVWSMVRLYIQAPSGRLRFNVLGALNATTLEVVTVTNQTYITSVQVCEMLTLLAAQGLGVPITVVLDNARYQRCKVVQAQAESLGIELLFLPPYSPNLNLIERLWKFVKKQCLYSKYYEKFDGFKEAISDCLSATSTTHKNELKSLLTLNFQTFEKAHIVPV